MEIYCENGVELFLFLYSMKAYFHIVAMHQTVLIMKSGGWHVITVVKELLEPHSASLSCSSFDMTEFAGKRG